MAAQSYLVLEVQGDLNNSTDQLILFITVDHEGQSHLFFQSLCQRTWKEKKLKYYRPYHLGNKNSH